MQLPVFTVPVTSESGSGCSEAIMMTRIVAVTVAHTAHFQTTLWCAEDSGGHIPAAGPQPYG